MYITSERVVILGETGRNFAAGMSGGIAYVLDSKQNFSGKVNTEMVELSGLSDPLEIAWVCGLIEDHYHYTGSEIAKRVLLDFRRALTRFVKVLPTDYKRILEEEAAKAANAKAFPNNISEREGEKDAAAAEQGHKHEGNMTDLEDSILDTKAQKKK